jgi:hypothetical protein
VKGVPIAARNRAMAKLKESKKAFQGIVNKKMRSRFIKLSWSQSR